MIGVRPAGATPGAVPCSPGAASCTWKRPESAAASSLERRLPACLPSNAAFRRYFRGAVVCAAGRSADAPFVILSAAKNHVVFVS